MKRENDDDVWFRYDAEWFRYVGLAFGIALVLIFLLYVLPLVLQASYDTKPFIRAAVTYVSYMNPYLLIVVVVIILLVFNRYAVHGSLKNKQKKRRSGMKKMLLIVAITFSALGFFAEPSFSAKASLDQLGLPAEYSTWPHGAINRCDANGKKITIQLFGKFAQASERFHVISIMRIDDEILLVVYAIGPVIGTATVSGYLPGATGVLRYNLFVPAEAKKFDALLREQTKNALRMNEKEISDLFMFKCAPLFSQTNAFVRRMIQKEQNAKQN